MLTVMYACDDNYARQTLISMVSVMQYHKQVLFYLFHDGMSEYNQELFRKKTEEYGQQIRIIPIGRILPELSVNAEDRHPATIYAKLFMEAEISEPRVLYLDSDTVVNGSLEPLFARDMENELAAGVLMPYSSGVKRAAGAEPRQTYICDGVVLFNLELWKRLDKSEECSAYIREHGGNPPMLSEGTLNHVCRGMLGVLEPKYNLMPAMLWYTLPQIRQLFRADCYYGEVEEASMREACTEPVVIHFMEELYNRPWREPCDHPWKESYRTIERKVFGECRPEDRPLSLHTRVTRRLKEILPFGVFAALYHIKNGI